MKYDIQYPSAKVVLRSKTDNKILLLARTIDHEVGYEPAGGKVEANFEKRISETFEDCAMREIREELGLESKITHYIGSYYYFWSLKTNACSHCILFLADIISGEVTTAQQEECGILSPAWVSIEDIKAKKIPIRDYHVGLEDLLVKAVKIIQN
ncbi:MAG TPA: NUDIX hydrolase [Gammaproteobacteria bacterium]|nr:NUDIX hydrolase [Gammaproteobacteria bacterium]